MVSYPFGELSVHHEVMHVLLGFGEFELSGNHSYHKGRAACTLPEDIRGPRKREHTVRRQNTRLGVHQAHCVCGINSESLTGQDTAQSLSEPCLHPDIPIKEGICNAFCLVTLDDLWGMILHRTGQFYDQLYG